MSILGMADRYVEQQWWHEIQQDPARREAVRIAARAVLEAPSEVEYRAIVELRMVFPNHPFHTPRRHRGRKKKGE